MSENYGPKNFFRPPIQAGRWRPYLNYNTRFCAGNYFMVCIRLSNYETNFLTSFRRHYVDTSESYYFENQLPMTAETQAASRSTPSTKSSSYSCAFVALLNSMDFTTNSLWWGRMAVHDSVVTLGEHYESLLPQDKELYLAKSKVD